MCECVQSYDGCGLQRVLVASDGDSKGQESVVVPVACAAPDHPHPTGVCACYLAVSSTVTHTPSFTYWSEVVWLGIDVREVQESSVAPHNLGQALPRFFAAEITRELRVSCPPLACVLGGRFGWTGMYNFRTRQALDL